ncbi:MULTISPECIES: LysR family transcriptional regulator [unclassified Cupriavidus]|uniref:LysR family transcriptional regulator n=1 Tax=unclassified Cupriavidus TaxID=2640874 RepID=UPI00088F22AD|nr:LysR family transcriptional regulator [Cupriavidus sp. YR651]SDC91564.1 DNA-binding transcriptional regulator, LysR family [Cupriavidus sp. YR651]
MRHHVTLKQLRCFLAVAEAGTFTAAALRLCMTQSALTATIQQMEEAIGLRMFDRTTRRVVMTDHAERFVADAERVVNGFDSAVSDLVALARGDRGHIRIGAASSVIRQFLVPALPRFREAYPGITISLRNPAAQQTERLVLEGEVDFAIDSKYRGHEELDYTPLVTDCYGVVFHRDSPLAEIDRPLTWDDLTWGQYIGFSADTGIGQFLRTHAAHWPVLAGDHDEVESTTYLFAMLARGKYYSVLPALAYQRNEFPDLIFRELHAPALSRELCVITRPLRSLSPSAQRLLTLLRETLAGQTMPLGVSLMAS